MPTPSYSFLPYLRRGLAQQLSEPDAFAATGTLGRQQLLAEIVVAATPIDGSAPRASSFQRQLAIAGPGDVLNIKASAVIRSVPHDGAADALADRLAFVELYEEDLPWRYTPAAPNNDRLRPWIALIVLALPEFVDGHQDPGSPLPPFVTLQNATLPPPGEVWAWAHVQVAASAETPEAARAALDGDRDACLARLVCPRRLAPNTRYVGLAVPTFESGRRAGLGANTADLAAIPAQQPAWGVGAQNGLQLPYYYRFDFATNDAQEFEQLVRALAPNGESGAARGRPMRVDAPGLGLDGLAAQPTVLLDGALRPPGPATPSTAGAVFYQRLEQTLDASDALAAGEAGGAHPFAGEPGFSAQFVDDPIVLPPIYGRWHGGGYRITDAAHVPPWVVELNLDPRRRTAAGIGAKIVQDRDDELVGRAFAQLSGIAEIEQARREAVAAIAVGQSIFERHLATADPERALAATSAMHGAVRSSATTSVRADVEGSVVPRAALSTAFKRVSRPGGRLDRALAATPGALRASLLDAVNQSRASASPPIPEPPSSVSANSAQSLIASARAAYLADTSAVARWAFCDAIAAVAFATPNRPVDAAWHDAVRVQIDAALLRLNPTGDNTRYRTAAAALNAAVLAKTEVAAEVTVSLEPGAYRAAFGDISGKSYRGTLALPGGATRSLWVTAVAQGAPAPTNTARMSSPLDVGVYQNAFTAFSTEIVDGRTDATPPPKLGAIATVAAQVRSAVQPISAVAARALARMTSAPAGARAAAPPTLAQPVMAYPTFPDALVEDVRAASLDYLVPNVASLPPNSLTLLVPNAPFIEAVLAGANTELARELVWREFPTDMRGSFFLNFWDAGDAVGGADAPPLTQWQHALGGNLNAATTGVTVFVIRGALVRQYPNVVVYLQRASAVAAGQPRGLAAEISMPTLRAQLAPDTLAVAFPIAAAAAVADPGWFLVFKERPGELGFGMDDGPAPAFDTWDDLNFSHANVAEGGYIPLAPPIAPTHADPHGATWGRTSADMAYILFQLPFLMARHASELLP